MPPENNIDEKIYVSICTFFTVLIVLGNLIYQKFVSIPLISFYNFEISVGAITYPATFLLTDLITEFYGKDKANFCVKLGLVMNVLVALIIMAMDNLQATAWSKIDNETFHKIFCGYNISFLGSIIACYISQSIDIYLYLAIKKFTKDRHLWLRNNLSTAISLLIDTSLVISFLTIFKILPAEKMGNLIMNSYLFKLFFIVCSTPIFYFMVWFIKRAKNINQLSQP